MAGDRGADAIERAVAVRVLHVDPERGWGGGEVQVATLLGELAARGHASRVVAHPGGRLAEVAAGLGIPVVPLAVRNHFDLAAGLALRRLVAGHDVVHFHTARAHALAPLCRGQGARLVVTRRMDYVPAGGPYVRFLYNRAVDAVIAISAGVRDALLRVGVRPERIRVVPSGIVVREPADAAARARVRGEWGIDAQQVVVVLAGALERRKGHATLLAAARLLAPSLPELRYVFCGAGSQEAALREDARSLGDAVRFAGFRTDVDACFAAADVVVLPSLQEGLGVAALEAMAAERPVVASRVGGLAEAVIHGETGVLVPPADPGALAAALARVAGDAALRARLGSAGRAHVLGHYSAEKMAVGTLACYGGRPCG